VKHQLPANDHESVQQQGVRFAKTKSRFGPRGERRPL